MVPLSPDYALFYQLSMYLRPMGANVPAIYGESYDSAQAKKG